jgi:hypothetical protein
MPRRTTAAVGVIGLLALAGCGSNAQPKARRTYTYAKAPQSIAPNPAGGKVYTSGPSSG